MPALVMMKLVAVRPVEEPTKNAGPVRPLGLMESCAHGEVVPMPTAPEKVDAEVEVAMMLPM